MGSILDCCVSDEARQRRHEEEGIRNTDILPTDPLLFSTDETPNQMHEFEKQTKNAAKPSNTSNINNPEGDVHTDSGTESKTSPTPPPIVIPLKSEAIKQSLSSKHLLDQQPSTATRSTTKQNTLSLDSMTESDHEQPTAEQTKSATNRLRIIVTQPLSPRSKLQGPGGQTFESDDHPYSLHKRAQKFLAMGYIRRNNISSLGLLPMSLMNLIFDFYYFHYADYNSQMSILDDVDKQQKCIALITSDTDEDLAKFLDTILRSKLAEKMWNKFDSDLKGVIETDRIVQFLVLPVILYKSTLHHRALRAKSSRSRSGSHSRKNGSLTKPNLDKKSIKADAEHLAVWIMRNYGEQQPDNSYHFVLTKEDYMSGKLAAYIEHYIQYYFE